ncbi:MAG: DinB family protein [Phycisphaerales bacterium]
MDRSIIDRYEAQGHELKHWVHGLTEQELDAFPVPGTWSVRQLVVHMIDSDQIATHRMRRMAAEEKPLLVSYDETAFSKVPAVNAGSVQDVAELFGLNRRWTADFLRALPDAAFERQGVHTQRGLVTIGQMVEVYVKHVEHHRTFLAAKREKLGKPLR